MFSSEVVHFAGRGPEICPGNLGGNVKFPPPRKFYYLPRKFRGPEIPPLGPEFPPLRLVYIKGGPGWSYPLVPLFTPDPHYSKPPPPPQQGPLRRLPSRRIPQISPVLAPLGVGVLFLHAVFAMDSGIALILSFSRCLCPRSRFVWVDPFSIERSMFRGSFQSSEPSIELSWCRSFF
jgi:hypothetical protein